MGIWRLKLIFLGTHCMLSRWARNWMSSFVWYVINTRSLASWVAHLKIRPQNFVSWAGPKRKKRDFQTSEHHLFASKGKWQFFWLFSYAVAVLNFGRHYCLSHVQRCIPGYPRSWPDCLFNWKTTWCDIKLSKDNKYSVSRLLIHFLSDLFSLKFWLKFDFICFR